MSRLLRTLPVPVGALLAVLIAALLPVAAAGAAPNLTTVTDARGDQRTSGTMAAPARRSIDIHRVEVRRQASAITLTFRIADVRALERHRQVATATMTAAGLRTQRFATSGTRVTKRVGDNVRSCGSSTRRPGSDVITMRLPFACLRTVAGSLLGFSGTVETVPRDAGSGLGRAVDTTRRVLIDAR